MLGFARQNSKPGAQWFFHMSARSGASGQKPRGAGKFQTARFARPSGAHARVGHPQGSGAPGRHISRQQTHRDVIVIIFVGNLRRGSWPRTQSKPSPAPCRKATARGATAPHPVRAILSAGDHAFRKSSLKTNQARSYVQGSRLGCWPLQHPLAASPAALAPLHPPFAAVRRQAYSKWALDEQLTFAETLKALSGEKVDVICTQATRALPDKNYKQASGLGMGLGEAKGRGGGAQLGHSRDFGVEVAHSLVSDMPCMA